MGPKGREMGMAKVLAFVNQKGGVGKTTTAINLAAALSEREKRVLLCDFDPQGNATSGFGVDPRALETSIYDLIVADQDQEIINQAASLTSQAYQVSHLNREAMQQIGLQNCDVIVIGVGGRMDERILLTLYAIQLGVKRVIAKATSEEHGLVLQTLGAEVVYPERDMAVRLAKHLLAPGVLEYNSLSDDVDITDIQLTKRVHGKTVAGLDIRKQFGLNVIAVKQNGMLSTAITPNLILDETMTITVIGEKNDILRFESYLS